MPNMPQLTIDNVTYDLKDTEGQEQIDDLKAALNNGIVPLNYCSVRHADAREEGVTYPFIFRIGRKYRIHNIGANEVNIFTRNGDTTVETIVSHLLPQNYVLFEPAAEASSIRIFWYGTDPGGHIVINYGDAVDDIYNILCDLDIVEQDVASFGNIIPYPYFSKDGVNGGLLFESNGRTLHIEGTTTGQSTFAICGSWRIADNLKNTKMVPGKRYNIINQIQNLRIAFFDSNGQLLAQVNGTNRAFTIPTNATGVNIFYQVANAGVSVDETVLPLIIEAKNSTIEVADNYDCRTPISTLFDRTEIVETYSDGRKKITNVDGQTITETMYYEDGATIYATRITEINGGEITVNINRV